MTRDIARRGFWLASLFVPGWAQLMAGRVSAFAWLLAALAVWSLVGLALVTSRSSLATALPLAAFLHVLCALRATRLAHG